MMERAQSSDNDDQIALSKDRSHWRRSVPSQFTTGRLQQHNIVRIRAGPTLYFTFSIIHGIPLSSFHILFNEPTLKNILKCTTSEAHRVTGNNSWTVTLDELDKLMGLTVARGANAGRTLLIKSIWDKSWECPLFNATMQRRRFLKIIKFVRFDLKTERRRNLEVLLLKTKMKRNLEEKVLLGVIAMESVFKKFSEDLNPNMNITIDEQLISCTARCKFIQYMPNKPDKFGIKFWLAFDVESKYLYNGFSNLGKDWTRSGDDSLPTDVVMKLMIPLFRQGFNVTCDNFFTSLNLLLKLAKRQCSLLATIPANRKKIPDLLKKKRMLHSTMAAHSTGDTTKTIISYQCKQPKSLNILSTLHKKLLFQSTIIRSVSQKPCSFITRQRLVWMFWIKYPGCIQ